MASTSIRIRRCPTPTTQAEVIRDSGITYTTVADDPATVTLTVSELVAGTLTTPFYGAIEVRAGGEWTRPRNDLFVFHELSDRDEKDPSRMRTFTGVLYVADRAGSHFPLMGATSPADGSTTWKAASAGAVVADLLTRKPTHGITRTFTAAADSNGTPWPAADKTDHSFTPSSNLSSVISALAKGAYCQWYAKGTELVLELVNSGVDRTALPIGVKASSITPRESTTETASIFYVVSDQPGVPVQVVTRPELGAGPREAIVTVAGATKADVALRMAQPIIDRAAQKRLEWTVMYDAENLPAVPLVDFQVGDKFKVEGGTHRLVGVQITKGDKVQVRLTFGERFLTLAARIASRTAQLSLGSINLTGGSGVPITPGVVVPSAEPAIPTGLAVASNVGTVDAKGRPVAAVRIVWAPVTTTLNGADTLVTEYEVWAAIGDAGPVPIARTGEAEFRAEWTPAVRTVTVRAFNGLWSEFSDPLTVTAQQPAQIFTAPSLPQLESGAGLVVISWDGTLESGDEMPAQFDEMFAESAPELSGPWTRVGAPLIRAGQVGAVRGEAGLPVFVRFAWVDTSGRVSNYSSVAQIDVVGITPGDLQSIDDFFANEAIIANLTTGILRGGVIEVDMLKPNVGELLNIESNEGLLILTGRIEGVEEMATYYRFGPDGAIIGREKDPTKFLLRNDSASFEVNGVEATSWGPAGMDVPKLISDEATIANHRWEKSGDRTIVRWAGED